MKNKVALFVCRCGENIGGIIDTDALIEAVRQDGNVAVVMEHELLCSPGGKAFLTEKMREVGATHAVIAACSPRDHEAEFQKAIEEAGVNRFLLQMANIREHCAWVTRNPKEALQKSVAMVRAATRRVLHHEMLVQKEIVCNSDLVVVGAGIAGMEAALLASDSGRKVTLVEEKASAGGRVVEFDEVAPNLECAPCMLSPRMDALSESDNLRLLTNTRVTEVLGYLGNFTVRVQTRARLVDENSCIGCDECIQACPAAMPDPIQHGLGTRKAIYIPFPGSAPNCADIDRESCLRFKGEACSACADACPMGAVAFDQKDTEEVISCGAMLLATGDTPYVPETNNPWGFGALPNVYTLSQLERLSSNHGPTGGRVVKADGEAPRRVAVLHCVGRQELGYCSNVCCRAALKTSMLLQHEASDGEPTEVIHLYADLVVGSLLGSSLKERALKRGARLVQIQDVNRVKVTQDAPGMRVLFADGGGEDQELQVDMVILAAGCGPSKGTRELIEKLDITPDGSGFAAPDHPLLRSVESSIEGIFLAGCVSGPRSIAESVASAQAAAGAAMARVQPGKRLTVEVLTAHADESLCSKCLVCVSVCPYRACVYDEKEDRVHVNELLCHGCGTCVAACASGAASARHFSDRQLEAEIEEVLHG